MSKRRKTLGISDKGWDTIGKGVKWWLIAGGITAGVAVLIVGGVALYGVAKTRSASTASSEAQRMRMSEGIVTTTSTPMDGARGVAIL
jgi:hypothetical protein